MPSDDDVAALVQRDRHSLVGPDGGEGVARNPSFVNLRLRWPDQGGTDQYQWKGWVHGVTVR